MPVRNYPVAITGLLFAVFMLPLFSHSILNAQSFTGTINWQRSLGGINDESVTAMKRTSDGGYIILGSVEGNGGDVEGYQGGLNSNMLWLVKLDVNGTTVWKKCIGEEGQSWGMDIQETDEGGFVVLGYNTGIMKLNANGDIEWQWKVEGGYSVAQTNDGGYIIGGSRWGGKYAEGDYWIAKLNKDGTLRWQKTIGGNKGDYANKVIQAKDGGYLLAGVSGSQDGDVKGAHGAEDGWIVKLSAQGDVIWQRCLGGSFFDKIMDVTEANDGSYWCIGNSFSTDGDVSSLFKTDSADNVWIVKLSANGAIISQERFDGLEYAHQCDIHQTEDGGLMFSALINANEDDILVSKITVQGELVWQETLGGSGVERLGSLCVVSDNEFTIAATSFSHDRDVVTNYGGSDIWVANIKMQDSHVAFNAVYPIPSIDGKLFVDLKEEYSLSALQVFDAAGKRCIENTDRGNQHRVLNLKGLTSGVYLLKIMNDKVPAAKNSGGYQPESYKVLYLPDY